MKPIGRMKSSGRRKLENSPISIVARSQKLQAKSIVKSVMPAPRERGNRWVKPREKSGLMSPGRPMSSRKTPAMKPAV